MPINSVREVAEGRKQQGADEKVTYTIDTDKWGVTSPTNPSMVVKDSAGNDVSGTVASGSASISGSVITLEAISALVKGEKYKVEVQFSGGGFAPAECFFWIDCGE